MSFERPAPDINKLMTAWDEWERGEQLPGKVLGDLADNGWSARAE